MFFQRYYLESLSQASYMVADDETKHAAIIDPRRDIEIYLTEARKHSFSIKYVVLTHNHADFVAGHIELRDAVGAKIYLGAKAKADFDFITLHEGDEINLGRVRLKTLETPGHTPEGISILVFDDETNFKNPYAVLTGDTLFIGDVGRPDLMASAGLDAGDLGGMLYDSLHTKLLTLPANTRVYPAHGAGSMCGKSLSSKPFSTVDTERQENKALQDMDKTRFIQFVQEGLPAAPAYFSYNAALNRKERQSLETAIRQSLKRLEWETVLSHQKSGALVLDLRSADDFATSHLCGALNIGIDGRLETWVGTILKPEDKLVLIAEPTRIKEALIRLGRIGFHNVAGYLQGGMGSIKDRPDLLCKTQQMKANELNRLESPHTVIDIRTESEWESGHIQSSLNIPLNSLPSRLNEIPANGTLIVHCQGGYRSMIAASLLQKSGLKKIHNLKGGYDSWLEYQQHRA